MKIAFKEIKFRQASLELVEFINSVIDDYTRQGYDLTLRQLYYQLVARDVIENSERSYNNIGNLVNDARLAGLIDWDAIGDRTRYVRKNSHWTDPQGIIQSCFLSYHKDLRVDQPYYLEVWVEKDALIGIVEQTCERLDVPCFSCRGYVSVSEMYQAANRFENQYRDKIILHLGDHDPSGIDMTRDIQDRLALFGTEVSVKRIALNYDQIREYGPPPNPAKITDSRADKYIKRYGKDSWELDALEPRVLSDLIDNTIMEYTDSGLFLLQIQKQEIERAQLREVKENWADILEYLEKE